MTDLLLTAIKILKHSDFLKDLLENCIHYNICWLSYDRPLDPSIACTSSLPSSVVTENCCYPIALQWPTLQELNTWTQPSFSSMDVVSKPTTSTGSAKSLISTREIESQLSLNQTLYFCKLPPTTPPVLVLTQLPSHSVKGYHRFHDFMHYGSSM